MRALTKFLRKAFVNFLSRWTVHGGWSSWSAWNSRNKPCGTGFQERSRSCTSPAPSFGGKLCEGAARENNECNTTLKQSPLSMLQNNTSFDHFLSFLHYLVDGSWSSWSVSTPCSVTCGSGVEIFSRTCTNPAPKHGGRSCSGAGRKEQACSRNPCPSKYFWTAP